MSDVCDIVRALPSSHTSSQAAGAGSSSSSSGAGGTSSTPTETVLIDEFARFVGAAVRWAGGKAGAGSATREIHDQFAQYLWAACGMGQLGRAVLHFARGKDAKAYAQGGRHTAVL